jgi:hypothetical protein
VEGGGQSLIVYKNQLESTFITSVTTYHVGREITYSVHSILSLDKGSDELTF